MYFRKLGWLSIAIICFYTSISAQDASQRQLLHGHVRTAIASGQIRRIGDLPASQRLNASIVLKPRNRAELTALLKDLYDPNSPQYRKFLSVAEFADRFAPSQADYQAVIDFAHANGLEVTGAHANRLVVPISGTVSQIESAFQVKMGNYQHPAEDRTFYSADREPSVNLTVPVAHIAGLDNFSTSKPMTTTSSTLVGNAIASGTGSGSSYYISSDMRTAYYGGTALTGTGQTVGLFELSGYLQSDIDLYFSKVGQTNTVPINNVLLDGLPAYDSNYSDSEQVLDIVQAIGMAPGLSQVRVYIGSWPSDILSAIASENIANQVSISYYWSPGDPSTDDIFFQEMAAQGQSVFVASGSNGEFNTPLNNYFNYFPAEDAWVTAVGGTHLVTSGTHGSWSSELAWNASGGGFSPDGILIPSWQSGVANTANGGSSTYRNVPDVAMEADLDNYNCNTGTCSSGWGGTSFAAPRWAGFMALINQQAATNGDSPIGFLNPALYTIGQGTDSAVAFHDIMSTYQCCNYYHYNTVTGYDLTTGWGTPNGQNLIDALAPIPTSGFKLTPSVSTLSIAPSSTGTATITVTDISSFSGTVTLAVQNLPAGVTAAFGTNPTSGSSVLTLTADSTVVRGSYLITVTGTSGSLSAATNIDLQVNTPGFTILANTYSTSLSIGASRSVGFNITFINGFSNPINFAVTSTLPTGVTATWVNNPTVTDTPWLVLTADSTAVTGTSSVVTVTGFSGNQSATATFVLQIGPPTFGVQFSPYPSNLVPGDSLASTLTILPNGPYSDSVSFSYIYQYPYVTATFNPATTQTSSVLTLTAASNASAESGYVFLQITHYGTGQQYMFHQTVTTEPTFNLAVSPTLLTIKPGSSANATVTVVPMNGFTGTVALTNPTMPDGYTITWNPSSTAGTSTMTFTVAANAAPVTLSNFQITGTSGDQTAVSSVYYSVPSQPSFTLSAASSAVTVNPGKTVTNTLSVTPQTGFSGSVNLAVISKLPDGVIASFGTNPTTGNSVLTIDATNTTVSGTYSVIVRGTSGNAAATSSFNLTITPSIITSTVLSISPTGSLTAGSSYTLTAKVAPASGTTIPTGNVVFTIGSSTETAALDASGTATYTGTAYGAGNLSISAAYQGTIGFASSTSNQLNETIVAAGTTTALTIAPSGGSLYAKTSYTLTATVTPASGTLVPTGNVVFTIGTVQQTVAVNTSGVATCTGTAPGLAGTLVISAAYAGDSNFSASISNALNETIMLIPTTTALKASTSQITQGDAVTLTATVTATAGGITPSGTVYFYNGNTVLGSSSLSNGTASMTTASLPVGSDSLYVSFQGDAGFSASTSASVVITVNAPANPTPVLSGFSPAFKIAGSYAFSLTITGTGFTSGSTVYWGTTALTTQYGGSTQLTAQVPAADVASAGITAVTVQTPTPGGGTSNILQFEVDSAGSSVTAPSFTPVTNTITRGSSAAYTVTLPSTATNVSAVCLNLPTGATCSYNSTTGVVTVTTVSTTPQGTYQITVVFTETLPGAASAFVILPILLLPLVFARRRTRVRNQWITTAIVLAVLVAGTVFVTGCGGGGSGTTTQPVNPTHTVTSSATVNLTVQ